MVCWRDLYPVSLAWCQASMSRSHPTGRLTQSRVKRAAMKFLGAAREIGTSRSRMHIPQGKPPPRESIKMIYHISRRDTLLQQLWHGKIIFILSCVRSRIHIYIYKIERERKCMCVCFFSSHSRRHNYYTCPTSVRKHEKIRRVKGDILYKFIFQAADVGALFILMRPSRGNYCFIPPEQHHACNLSHPVFFFILKNDSRACLRL